MLQIQQMIDAAICHFRTAAFLPALTAEAGSQPVQGPQGRTPTIFTYQNHNYFLGERHMAVAAKRCLDGFRDVDQ